MICYHHNDLDGMSSAYVVHTYKPKQIEDSPSSYFACSYEDKFNKHTMKDDVIIVDISISEKTYPMLIETCKTARTVTWIDHHSTSKEVIENHYDELQSIRNLTYIVSEVACGSVLAYIYFHIPASEFAKIRDIDIRNNENYSIIIHNGSHEDNYDFNNTELYTFTALKKYNAYKNTKTIVSEYMEHTVIVPEWLQLVNDYDCWRKKLKDTDNFFFGVQTKDISFTIQDGENKIYNPFWLNQEIANPKDLIKKGETINEYIHKRYIEELKDTFEYTIDGTIFLCKNGLGNSFNFEHLIDKYEAVILFNYSGSSGKWEYSVYSGDKSTFNCAEFCKKYGGGGHFHASGFSTDKLIFLHKINKPKENIIFLGGTVNDDWRSKFIDIWKKTEKNNENLKNKNIKLINPVVEDWTPECIDKENEVKNKAALNLFLITPEQSGSYSFVEALDCAVDGNKVYLVIYDEYKKFEAKDYKSFDAIGKIIEKHNGIYDKYIGEDLEIVIRDVIASL